jgi:hypothetical protein
MPCCTPLLSALGRDVGGGFGHHGTRDVAEEAADLAEQAGTAGHLGGDSAGLAGDRGVVAGCLGLLRLGDGLVHGAEFVVYLAATQFAVGNPDAFDVLRVGG